MKGWVIFLVAAAALVGGWWWWRRRSGQPFVPVVVSNAGDPLQGYLDSLLGSSSRELPPVPPSDAPGWTDTAAKTFGQVYGAGGTKICLAYGVPANVCAMAEGMNAKAAELYIKAHVKAVQYTYEGAKWVGAKAVSGLKAITPFW